MSWKQTPSPKKKKVLIHIGMGRCGSSSIQQALMIKRSELAALGIYYPETYPGAVAQHVLGWLTDDKYEEAVEGWRNVLAGFEKSGCTTLLVSTERFIGITPKLFALTKRVLSGYSVKVVFIIRNQRELLPSICSQWIKAGIEFRSFEHFYSVTKQEWHFTKIIDRWSQAYGVENIKCGILRSGSDAVEIFADCCGDREMTKLLTHTQIRINGGMNPRLLWLIVLFNRFKGGKKIGSVFPGWNNIEPSQANQNDALRKKLLQYLEVYSVRLCKGGGWKLPKTIEAEILVYYWETNKLFHSTYLNCQNNEWLDSK